MKTHCILILSAILISLRGAAAVMVDGEYVSQSATNSGQLPGSSFDELTSFPDLMTGDLAESGTASSTFSSILGSAGNVNNGDSNEAYIFANESGTNGAGSKSLVIDLGSLQSIGRVNTYVHNRAPTDAGTSRANQIYTLYMATGSEGGFVANGTDFSAWTAIASVSTKNVSTIDNNLGGLGSNLTDNSYGFTALGIYDDAGGLGTYRYIGFDISPSKSDGTSDLYPGLYEIDVIAVPEPGSLALVGLGLAALFCIRARRK